MKILFVIHAAFEQPGCIERWANKKGYQTQMVCTYQGEQLPDVKDFDFLVVMGGPQSPLEMKEAPYLRDEIELIKNAIQAKKRIIGICLGAQLIGEALGAKTERSPNREIGMYPVELLKEAEYDPVFQLFSTRFDVMHWHSDMPGIPTDAVLLAKSKGCPRQVFRYGDRIYGFQCHFELTQDLIKRMIESCPSDLKEGAYIMSNSELLKVDCTKINLMMERVLDYLADLPKLMSHENLKNMRV